MNKRPEITAATRQAFMTALIQLATAKPLNKITVNELTARAGYNRSTFYHHFADIYALYQDIEDDMIATVFSGMAKNLTNFTSREDFVGYVSPQLEANHQILLTIFTNASADSIERQIKRPLVDRLKGQFQIAPDDLAGDYRVYFFISGACATLQRWLQGEDDFSSAESAGLIYDLLDQGLLHALTGQK